MTELNNTTFQTAIDNEQPTVVDFWAGWCMPCKMFGPIFEEASDEMDGKADFYKVNVDDNGELAERYDVTTIPTVIVFKKGEVADRFVGVRNKEEVVAVVEKQL
jgi:thioredoxin 1